FTMWQEWKYKNNFVEKRTFNLYGYPWKRIYAVALGTFIAGLIWVPVFINNSYGDDLTDWIQAERVGFAWISPIFQAIAAWITMISLLPVEASQLAVVIASGLAMIIFFIWLIPILIRAYKVQLSSPQNKLMIQALSSFILGAIILFFIFTYFLGIDLTRGARYNFVYFPAVMVLMGAILAAIWDTKSAEKIRWGVTGKQAVAIILLMGFISSITVVCNLGYQKYYRPDLFVKLIENTSQNPVLIATTQKTHVQIGEMLGVAREFKLESNQNLNQNPKFLLAHQEKDRKAPTITLQNTLKTLSPPIDLWLVNFHAPAEVNNCIADDRALPNIDGYEYKLFHCE
ncbi:MAG: glycosyltransferase, partial [Rivularia sp. (in: cyanobacteria)]